MPRKRLADVLKNRPKGSPLPDDLAGLLVLWAKAIDDFAKDGGRALIKQGDALLKEVIEATDQTRYILKRFYQALETRMGKEAVKLFSDLTQAQWREIILLSMRYVQTYIWPRTGLSRRGAINALKGFINELLFFATKTYRDEVATALTRAQDLARKLGIPEGAIDLRRYDDVIARTVDGAGKVSNEALGDGILGFEHDGILYVLTVFEMKSPSNRRHLRKGPVDTAERLAAVEEDFDGVVRLLTAREGQISRDVERLAEADLFVDGVEILEGGLKFDRDITHFVGVMPKGQKLVDGDVDALQKIWKNFRQVEQTIPDEAIRVLAKELLRILSGK
ncbi:hypothetical protein J7443_22350 [Tropicibacter sp. R15_0]|uniref:hypothetical protein n=1 Tax=Tropicibacter sp. R15_0 TaxID=2821101 RepID=UPI001ADA364F|nr:hypothetical protein [Tropicibacter sp. R15_0]MBO9467990.1 hypothetical protein [Tropicibacter sp. R15_0]